MELIKKNIHINRNKCKANTQLTLDDDYNVPDSKPDIYKIIFEKGIVKIEEMKVSEGHINIKGTLLFSILYLGDTADKTVYSLEGKLPFEEMVYMDCVESGDTVKVDSDMENLRINTINTRKLSIQSIISLALKVEELHEERAATDIISDIPVEYRKKSMDVAELALEKKDIYRVREEFEIPSNLPNIFEILWNSVRPQNVEIKVMDQKLMLQGEVVVFILYEGEGEETTMQWHETILPFTGAIDCSGSTGSMLAEIAWNVGNQELEVKPDFDGEERAVGLDLVLDLDIKLYEEQHFEILSDVYGVTKEIEPVTTQAEYKKLLVKNNSKCRNTDKIKINNNAVRILQLCHSEGAVKVDDMELSENGINVMGAVDIQILYVTTDDNTPFYSINGSIPFKHTIEVPNMNEQCSYYLQSNLEQLSVGMLDSEEVEVKTVIAFEAVVFQNIRVEVIEDIKVSDLDMNKLKNLPGIVGYIVKEGDSLWQIGKKYYIPVNQIKESNELVSDGIKSGDKLLLVKTLS